MNNAVILKHSLSFWTLLRGDLPVFPNQYCRKQVHINSNSSLNCYTLAITVWLLVAEPRTSKTIALRHAVYSDRIVLKPNIYVIIDSLSQWKKIRNNGMEHTLYDTPSVPNYSHLTLSTSLSQMFQMSLSQMFIFRSLFWKSNYTYNTPWCKKCENWSWKYLIGKL
jgi:hypothetical protein